jgi:hypothetical protein
MPVKEKEFVVRRLSLKELEQWKRAEAARKQALEFLQGRQLCEKCMEVERILKGADPCE